MKCRSPYCANNPRSRSYEATVGILCDDCEAVAEREDEENPRCSVCEVRKDDHDDVFPCRIEDEQD